MQFHPPPAILCAMTAPPPLTDRAALARNRARATAFFLQEDAIAEVHERLIEVNRTFTHPAVVTGFPALWEKALPHAHITP
ncbi:MAG: hypothetical protein ACRC6I_20020, partial [Paracoccaceae bacterium]